MIFLWVKRIVFAAALAAAAYGGYFAYKNGAIEKLLTPSTEELKEVVFKTDGAITKAWAQERGLLPEKQNIAQIDVKKIQADFLAVAQIKAAAVAKIYPDKILIEIKERKPAARVAIAQNGAVREYMLSSDGAIFSPVCIPQEAVADLPWVMGIPIAQKNGGFEPYPPAGAIDELITSARAALPQSFETWRTINASELQSITLPVMVVSTTDNVKIIFHAKNIKFQLEKLEYILRYFEEEGLANVEKIDLSLKDMATASLRSKK